MSAPKKPSPKPKRATTSEEASLVDAVAATRGAPTNVRPAGPMEDGRTKRRRTRAARDAAAIDEA